MPELPDVVVYVERLRAFTADRVLTRVRLTSPFLVRTVSPPLSACHGLKVLDIERSGKRIIWVMEQDLFLVMHLMIAGRIRWKKPGMRVPARGGLAGFDFEHGTLLFTEQSKKKRASLHVVRGREALQAFHREGLDVFSASSEEFAARVRLENHTLKRTLTDPRLFDGIGNAYSDEILHHAHLSPVKWSTRLTDDEIRRLHSSTKEILTRFTDRLRDEVGEGFPDKVTAFRADMAVHGRYQKPCPDCGKPVQRIVFADNEHNYCAGCQTGGKLLADRALSRLMKKEWPKTLEAMEETRSANRGAGR